MKKILIGLSGLVILVFIVIIAVNAQSNTREKKKDTTEVSKNASKCPAASACGHMKDTAAVSGEAKQCCQTDHKCCSGK
jgi:hypothetical protein